jgi:hypothetical protein
MEVNQYASGSPTPGEGQDAETRARTLLRSAKIVRWGLLAGGVVALGIVAAILNGKLDETVPPMILMVFSVFSALNVVMALFLVPFIVPLHSTQVMATEPLPGSIATQGVPGRLFTRAILSGAFSEIPAMLGFVLFVLGLEPQLYVAFLAATVVSSAMTFPRWSVWEAALMEDGSLPMSL